MAVASLSPGERSAAAPATAGGGGEEAPLAGVKGAEGVPASALAEAGKGVPPARGVPVAAAGCAKASVVKGVLAIAAEGRDVAEGLREGEEAPAVEGNGVAEEEEEGVKWLKHYSSIHSILVVGDGDFSFSRALATAFGSGENLVATSLDSYETLRRKYSKAESNIMELKRMGATVLHGVDAKMMKLHTDLKMRHFDRIVFNFPHAGFKGKENQVHMINLHQELVRYFFRNSSRLLRPFGEIHVSHKTGMPYDRWDIKQLASESSLILVEQVEFHKEDYPGYNQKRGDGANCDQPFKLGACCTFKFCRGDVKKLKKARGNRISSLPSLGGGNVHRDTTDRGSFHPLPPVLPWSLQHSPPPVYAVRKPITLEPYPLGVTQRPYPGFPAIFHTTVETPHFHRPMFSIPEPQLNVLPTPAGIPPPSRIARTTFLAPQQQHWHEQRPILPPMSSITSASLLAPQKQPCYQQTHTLEPLGRGYRASLDLEYRRNLQRYHEGNSQVMPGGASSDHSTFLNHRLREFFDEKEWLEKLIAFYGRPNDR